MTLNSLPPSLRWLLVLPTSVIAALLASVAVWLFYQILVFVWEFMGSSIPARYQTDPDDAFNFYAYRGLAGAAMAYAFVFSGVEMSPSAKRVVAIVLAVLVVGVCIVSLASSISNEVWHQVVYAGGGIVGGIVCARLISEE